MATIPEERPAFTYLEIDMPVTGEQTWTDCYGHQFRVETANHVHVVHAGKLLACVVLHGTTVKDGARTNATLSTYDAHPDWLPTPPPEWQALADALRKSVES